jgi:hypothetical protein
MNMVNVNDQVANLAQIVQRCPTITLARAFARAYRDWACQSQYLRLAIAGATVADTRQYDLGSDPYLDIVAVRAVSGSQVIGGQLQQWPIVTSDSSQWDPNMPAGMPVRYCYIPQAQIALDPLPNGVYNLLVTVIVQPKEDAVQIPQSGLVKYRSAVEAGALSYLYCIPKQPWTNPIESVRRQKEFQAGVSNAKAEVQRSFNTGSVRVRPRPFVR